MTEYMFTTTCPRCRKPDIYFARASLGDYLCKECQNRMTEIRYLISQSEINMLKDFMEGNCGIDRINLEWTDELYSLLKGIGDIVTDPDFDTEMWREMYGIK